MVPLALSRVGRRRRGRREGRDRGNGFGSLVAIPGRQPVGFRGEVPAEVLADLATSRAYIFWLEALAQLLSLATVCDSRVLLGGQHGRRACP